jgi:hypothetical protein
MTRVGARIMTPEEHILESRDSALTADRLFSENKELQGAEITWCSIKHAVNAIGVQRGWKHSTYGQKREVIRRLEQAGHNNLMPGFADARSCIFIPTPDLRTSAP